MIHPVNQPYLNDSSSSSDRNINLVETVQVIALVLEISICAFLFITHWCSRNTPINNGNLVFVQPLPPNATIGLVTPPAPDSQPEQEIV